MTMIFPRLRRVLTLVVTSALMFAGAITAAPAASAIPGDYCSAADPYLLLSDPTGAADQALCRVQEATLKQLSEDQWGIPFTGAERTRMLDWGKQASLGAMYLELLHIAELAPSQRTADEATVYTWLQQTLAALRNQMAEGAYAEQIAWASNPCTYTPPTPGATATGCGDSSSLTTLFGEPPGPTYEQFVSYGAQRVLTEDFGGDQLALIAATARSAQNQLIGAAVGAAGGIVVSAALVAAASAGLAYSAALTGVVTTSTTAAVAASAATGALVGAVAASIFFVVIAVTSAVVKGVQVFDQAKIPGQLRDDIAAAKQPVDIKSWVGDDSSRATLLLQAIARRINSGPGPVASVPGHPAADAPDFLVTSGVGDTAFTQTLHFRSPVSPDTYFDAFLDGDWWVIRDSVGNLAMSRDLVYLDHRGFTRSASWTGDQFLVTTVGVVSPDTECTEVNGCEKTDALEIITVPAGADPTATVPQRATATLYTPGLTFTHLPDDIATRYDVGDAIHALVSAAAGYPTTMSYRWELARHDPTGDKTTTVDGSSLAATLAIPGDYRLRVTATATSMESATHTWDFTVAGDAGGQTYSGIQLTQYAEDDANPSDNTPGPWREGTTAGTICLSTGSTEATDFTIQFSGEDAMTAADVAAGFACFPRPASAGTPGSYPLANVSACPSSTGTSLCWPTSMQTYENGQWVQTSMFSYAVTNEPPTAGLENIGDVEQGTDGDTLTLADPAHPAHFTVGDTVEAKTTVSDAGGGLLTVHIRWSDGTSETRTDLPSGTQIDVTHTYSSVAWGPVGVQIQAVDDTGAAGNLASGWFVVQPRAAKLALTASADATTGLVTLTGKITDPDRTASILGVDWGDGSGDGSGEEPGYRYDAPFPLPLDTAASSAADLDGRFQLTHHYATRGGHEIQAVLFNGAADYATATASVTVPNAAPVVVSPWPITVDDDDGNVSLEVAVGDFDAGDTLALHADFGDGSGPVDIASGKASGDTVTLTHHYPDGRHTITLTAEDATGATSSTLTRCFVLTAGVVTPCTDALPDDGDAVRSMPAGPVTAPASAERGTWITISLGAGAAGHTVTIYLYSTPTLLGTPVADALGDVTVRLPTSAPVGAHTLAVFDGAALVGWAAITVTAPAGGGGGSSGDGSESGSSAGAGSSGDTGGSSGGASGSSGDRYPAGASDGATQPGASPTGGVAPAAGQNALAATGLGTSSLLGLALLLLAAGGALVIGSRRRTRRI